MGRPSVAAPGQPSAAGEPGPAPMSAWSPFRHRMFAAMWGGQFVSNIGGWMQTVAAQWLMLSLTTSATYVALVQTAAGLPVVLFAIMAGTIGDLVDRRHFLLVTQTRCPGGAAAGDLARLGEPEPGPGGGPGDRRPAAGRHERRHGVPDQRGHVWRGDLGDLGLALHPGSGCAAP